MMSTKDTEYEEIPRPKHVIKRTTLAILCAIATFLLIVWGLATYLTPNDMARCDVRPSQKEQCQAADFIVAISGGDTPARAERAIELYQNGWAKKIIFSGAAADKSGPSNAEAMKKTAVQRGVPEDAVIIEELSETTKQNADKIEDLVMRSGAHRMLLVTSAYHERRAILEFNQRFGGTVEIVAAPVIKNDKQWSKLWWLTPVGWWLAAGEFVKIIGFYMGVSR